MKLNNKNEPLMFIETNNLSELTTQNQIEFDSRYKTKTLIINKNTSKDLLLNKLMKVRNISFYCSAIYLNLLLIDGEQITVVVNNVTRNEIETNVKIYSISEISDIEIEKVVL